MAVNEYTPGTDRIVHSTAVDFSSRPSTFAPVRVVQYDNKLPIVAVTLYNNGKEYVLPSGASANVRHGKRDGHFVENPVLGCSKDRKIIYFEISQQMVTGYGKFFPILELIISGNSAGSSPITLIVDKNPIQDTDIASSEESKTLMEYVAQAEAAKDAAASSARTAEQHKNAAAHSASQASASQTAAAGSAATATQKATDASNSASAAASDAAQVAKDKQTVEADKTQVAKDKASVTDMKTSIESTASDVESARAEVAENTAKTTASEANAKQYADNALASQNAAAGSAAEALASQEAAAQSESNAEDWSKKSESWAIGGTDTREGENTNNSMYWSKQSESSATRAEIAAENAEKYSSVVAPTFFLDETDMQLYIKDGVGMTFQLTDGILYWQLT